MASAIRNANATEAEASRKLKVFISYSRSDAEFADEIAGGLEYDGGYEVLIDRDAIHEGEDWMVRLGNLIASADTIVFILSSASANSKICAWEVEEAERLSKRIVPIQAKALDSVKAPSQLAALNYVRFDPHDDGRSRSFVAGLTGLRRALNTDIEWLREHTRLLTRAQEWHRAGRVDNRMLVGSDILDARQWMEGRPKDSPAPTELHYDYIIASEQAEADRLSAERRRAERLQRAVTWTRRALVLALVLALATGTAGVYAIFQQREAEQQREVARGAEKAAESRAKEAQTASARAESSRLEAAAARELAERRLDSALTTQSRFLADLARQEIVAQRPVTAMQLALNALPDPALKRKRPYVAMAEKYLYRGLLERRELSVIGAHLDDVIDLAFSKDRRFFVTGSKNGSVKLWDATTGKSHASWAPRCKGHDNGRKKNCAISQVAIGLEGTRVAATTERGIATLWDAKTYSKVADLEGHDCAGGRCNSPNLVFAPKTKLLATTDTKGTKIKLWNAATGALVRTLEGHAGPVSTIAFSPDGSLLASATLEADEPARVWHVNDGNVIGSLDLKKDEKASFIDRVTSLAFSPDSKRLVANHVDGTVRTYDAATLKTIKVYERVGGPTGVGRLQFSPIGGWMAVRYEYSALKIFPSEDWEAPTIIKEEYSTLPRLAISPNGEHVVAGNGSDGSAIVASYVGTSPEVQVRLRGHLKEVSQIAYGASNSKLFTSSLDGTVRIWNPLHAPAVTKIASAYDTSTAMFSPDGRRLISVGRNSIRISDAETGEQIGKEAKPQSPHRTQITASAVDPSGRFVATGGKHADVAIRVWDAESGSLVKVLREQEGTVRALAFSPDGTHLAVGHDYPEHVVAIWNVETGAIVVTLVGHKEAVVKVAFRRDGRRIASASHDSTVKLWDAQTGKLIRSFEQSVVRVENLTFSSDGMRLAFGTTNGKLIIIDGQSGEVIADHKAHEDNISTMAFGPLGKVLATGSSDGFVHLWDAKSGSAIRSLKGRDGPIYALSFHPQGQRIATSSFERVADKRKIEIWDIGTGDLVGNLPRAGGVSLALAFRPDGKRLVTVSDPGGVQSWRVFPTTEELVKYAKGGVPRCLSIQQRRDIFLESAPPRWCITGAGLEAETNPSKWQPKWPYHTSAWRAWLAARDRGKEPDFPE
jgi:WD40 repeat protein